MPTRPRIFASMLLLGVIAACVVACGGSSGTNEVIASVGATPVTKAEVSHWISTLVGGDYYEVSHQHTVPAGLVAEPANYGECLKTLEIGIAHSGFARKNPTAELMSKCHELYRALKEQTAEYLVEEQWLTALAREAGVTAGEKEIHEILTRIKHEFLNERRFQQFLADNRRSLADELFVIKLDVLRQKLSDKAASGGRQAIVKLVEAGRRWAAKTSCKPGYVVEHCRQFTSGSKPAPPAPAVLLEQVSSLVGAAPCVNRGACG
jgi:hypothetical protein